MYCLACSAVCSAWLWGVEQWPHSPVLCADKVVADVLQVLVSVKCLLACCVLGAWSSICFCTCILLCTFLIRKCMGQNGSFAQVFFHIVVRTGGVHLLSAEPSLVVWS